MEHTAEILEQLKEINEKVTNLCTWQAQLNERCRTRGQEMQRLQDVLFGNPRAENGVLSRVQRLWDCKKDSKEQHQVWINFWLWVIRVLGITAIITVVRLIWQLSKQT